MMHYSNGAVILYKYNYVINISPIVIVVVIVAVLENKFHIKINTKNRDLSDVQVY